MSEIKVQDYNGHKELDPQCAPDEVDMIYICTCESCGQCWEEEHEPESCPNCNEDNKDAFSFHMEPV